MLGWMIVFAILTILGTVLTVANPASVSALVGLTFALLFLLGLLARLVRGRAR